MIELKINKISFEAEEYIKLSYFNNLYENFVEMMDLEDDDVYLSVNKHLLASVIACIEGNVNINFREKSWHYWSMERSESVNINCMNSYVLLSIYDFVNTNNDAYNFITRYYNLWHQNENSDFVYDKFHKMELVENFHQLIYVIKEDIKTAINRSDKNIAESLSKLHDVLINICGFSEKVSC